MTESEFLWALGRFSRINPLLALFQARLRTLLGTRPERYNDIIEWATARCETEDDVWNLDPETLQQILHES